MWSTHAIFSRACSSIFSSSHCSVLCVRCLQKHSTSTSSLLLLLFPSNRTNTCSPPTGHWFGRFAEQSPLTGYEANAPVEMSSTGATPIILLSRKGSIGSTCNSVDDLASTPAVSETSERVDLGMLASPLLSQETETSANPSRICHSNRESSETSFSHLRSGTGNPWRDVRTREIQVETRVLCKTLNQNEKKFFLSIEIYAISLKCELTELLKEKELLKHICLKKNIIRGGFLSETLSELDRQELRDVCADSSS